MSAETTIKEGKRWSSADWASEKREIMIVGQGGIGGWLTLCLSRIEHSLYTVDPDVCDATNVAGGQMFRSRDIGRTKVDSVARICREFGCINSITPIGDYFDSSLGCVPIVLSGLDNMDARKLVFKEWKHLLETVKGKEKEKFLLIDGRLNLEDYEILCVQGDNPEQIEQYERDYLFNDEDVADAPCTAKQTTYTAMGIASFMTAILCNWLTNRKLGENFREIPFRTRIYYPAMLLNVETVKEEALI